jgi:methyl-accepting chemotaxis protein
MKLKLGARIGSGFGFLLLIAGLLGGLAVWSMGNVAEEATMLEKEYVPEVRVANALERRILGIMLEMRGYGLTGEMEFYSRGMERLEKANEGLLEAEALAKNSPHLTTLGETASGIGRQLQEYESLIGQTLDINAEVDANRAQLIAASAKYMETCAAFLDSQNKNMKRELRLLAGEDESLARLDKITKVNDVIDLGNELRVAVWRSQAERGPDQLKEAIRLFPAIEKELDALQSVTTQAENLAQIREIRKAGEAYNSAMSAYLENFMALKELAGKREAAGNQALEASDKLAKAGMGHAERIASSAVNILEQSSTTMIIGLLIALVIGSGLAFLLARSITGPVRKGVALAGEIAKGDFSKRLNMTRSDEIGVLADALDIMADGLQKNADLADQIADGNLDVEVSLASEKDQLGHALQNMTRSLNGILGQTMVAVEQVATGSAQVSDASQSLSQGATESASSLEEITSSMAEMASQTKLNAENASQASTLSGDARKAAENGNSQMKQLVGAMGEINDAGQSINRIIKVIDEIAFQTNLLALNAAVEAARAGQHGKGFAVVAEEVRNLAARSAKAASETAELIEGSVQKAENGAEIADRTARALEEIVSGITRATDLVGEIAAASNEQAQGIGQVNQGLGQIDQVTQQNTANAEESAAAAEELSGQATELRQLLSRFRLKGMSRQKAGLPAAEKPVAESNPSMLRLVSGKRKTSRNNGETPVQYSEMTPPEKEIALDDSEFGKY